MIFKRYEWRLVLRIIILFITLLITAWLITNAELVYLFITLPALVYEFIDLLRFQRKTHDEITQFVEGVHYRDFSRYFDERRAPTELKPLRKGFNEINSTFKLISRERETQYHYLQKVLELVDTGILSYEQETGETGWINDSFKRLLGIPYLKSIHSLEKRESALYHDIINIK